MSMMVCKGRLDTSSLGVNIRGITCLLELGGHALCRGGSNGLDQWLGPTPRKCGRERSPGYAARLWSLLEGHTSAESKRMWHVTPCSGKELRTRQERCSQGTNTLCWLSGIVFGIKSTFWRNVYKNLHCQMTLGSKAVVSASNTLYSIWTCWVTLVTHPTPS
jgi:hypothetical protein